MENNYSPIPKGQVPAQVTTKSELMDFNHAVDAMRKGLRVARKIWDISIFWCAMSDLTLCIRQEDGKMHPWILTESDIEAEDYIVIA